LAAQPAALAAEVNRTGSAKEASLLDIELLKPHDYTLYRVQIGHQRGRKQVPWTASEVK